MFICKINFTSLDYLATMMRRSAPVGDAMRNVIMTVIVAIWESARMETVSIGVAFMQELGKGKAN